MLNQKGATLILGLLILSAVLATSILVAGIVFRELKLSFATADSSNAYYAAESGSEMALYRYFKINNKEAGEWKGELPEVGTRWITRSANTATKLAGTIGQHQTKEVPLYDIESDKPLSGLSSAEILWKGGGIMEYSLFGWNEDEPINFFTKSGEIKRGMMKASDCVSPGGDFDCKISFSVLDQTKKYIVRFRPTCDSASSVLCSGSWDYEFKAYNFSGVMDIPIGYQIISSGFKGDEFKRSLEAIVPLRGEAFGIFDYGIFSDMPLYHSYNK